MADTMQNMSFRIDEKTMEKLDAIKEYKDMDNYSSTIRFLIRNYYKKKIEGDSDE